MWFSYFSQAITNRLNFKAFPPVGLFSNNRIILCTDSFPPPALESLLFLCYHGYFTTKLHSPEWQVKQRQCAFSACENKKRNNNCRCGVQTLSKTNASDVLCSYEFEFAWCAFTEPDIIIHTAQASWCCASSCFVGRQSAAVTVKVNLPLQSRNKNGRKDLLTWLTSMEQQSASQKQFHKICLFCCRWANATTQV